MIDTPNIDKLEAIFAALSDNADISCQPSTAKPGTALWTVTFRNAGGFYVGQANTMAGALADVSLVESTKRSVPTVEQLERIAAPIAEAA